MIPPEARHVIPPPPVETVVATSAPESGGGAGDAPLSNFLPPTLEVSVPDVQTPYIVFLVALIAVVAAILLASRTVQHGESNIVRRIAGRPFRALFWSYSYPGLKGELRKAFDEMVRRASEKGARIHRSMTPLEAAGEASRAGLGWAVELARIYYEGVFSRRGPSEDLVRRAWRLVKGEG